jgi:plasmid maintenance system antidote protein VapI
VFGNSPEFWLNVQRRTDLWEATNSSAERSHLERERPEVLMVTLWLQRRDALQPVAV